MKLLVAALVLASLPQEAFRNKWAGFREGSSCTMRINLRSGSRDVTRVTRTTIAKVDGDKVTLKSEETGFDSKTVEIDTRPELKASGRETLDVDGKSFVCTIVETDEAEEDGGKRHVKLWYCKDAPGRLVRQEQVRSTSKGDIKGDGRLTKLGQRKEVGRATVTYAIFEFKAAGPDGYEASITRWVSEEVPGFSLRDEQHEKTATAEMTRLSELVEFEAK